MTDIPSGYTPGPDLVEMLRNQVEHWNSGLRFVAADEIVRLRSLNAELLEASRKFVVAQDGEGDDDILNMLNYGEAVDALRALIAKAEGRT